MGKTHSRDFSDRRARPDSIINSLTSPHDALLIMSAHPAIKVFLKVFKMLLSSDADCMASQLPEMVLN